MKQSQNAVEKYYSVTEIALLWSCCSKTVVRLLKAREFGETPMNLGSEERPDYRIPASAVNACAARRQVFTEPGIAARSVGELRRKAAERPSLDGAMGEAA
jgi:hypothetical protein